MAAIEAAKASQLNVDMNTVKTAATEFSRKFRSYAITSRPAFESLFTNANLRFNFLEYHNLKKQGELSGPSVPSNAEFAHVIAERSIRGRP